MKKFLLMVIAIIVIGCQSNTEAKLALESNIVGTWEQVKQFEDNQEIQMNHCDYENFIQFRNDSSMEYGVFKYPNCDLDDNSTYKGNWSKVNNDLYEFLTDERFKVEFIDQNNIKVSEKEDLQGDYLIFNRK